MIRTGFHCAQPLHQKLGLPSSARASFYIYNTKEEIDKFINVIKSLVR
jgi:cysteine desulfurase/selenocysteine lyase